MFTEETFRVVVEVIDVQGLVWPAPTLAERAASAGKVPLRKAGKLPSPFVDVLVGDVSHSTAVREATATCSFNRVFVFSDVDFEDTIDVRVCHKTLLSHELIGSYLASVEEIRALPHHRMAQTLCPLIVRDAPSEPRGFVRLSISVLKSGEAVELSEEERGVAAGGACRILYTPELDFESYNLNVDIHMGLDILKTKSPAGSPPPSCYVRVEFGGTELRTNVQQLARTPTWNETLRFPATVPCSSDRISVELWEERSRISVAYLSFQQILKSSMKPTWLNLYTETNPKRQPRRDTPASAFAAFAALFELDDGDDEADALTEFYYLGRILVSANCVKHKSPAPAQSSFCRPVETPIAQDCVLWGNLFDISGLHKVVDVRVDVAFGDWLVSVKPKGIKKDAVTFSKEEGELPENVAFLPVQLDSAYDLIIRVYSRPAAESSQKGRRRFIAYARLAASDLIKKSGEIPEWIQLQRTTRGSQSITGDNPLYLLAGFSLQKAATVRLKNIERHPRLQFSFEIYKFQVSFFQAVELPVHRATMPSPYVTATLGGNSVSTRTISYTTHPDWNELLTFDCTLPSTVTLARDLVIQVVSGKTTICEVILSVEYLTTGEAQKPQWYPMTSQRFPKTNAKILCCFRLMKSDAKELETEFPAPEYGPDYAPYDLMLFVVGVRLFSSVTPNRPPDSKPLVLQLEFGRSPTDPNIRLWSDSCQSALKGANGNFNYLTPFEVKCYLPTNEIMQSFLDIRVFSQLESGPSEIGTAYLHLTSIQSGISRQIQNALLREFGSVDPVMDEITPPPLSAAYRRPDILSSLDRFGRALATELSEDETSDYEYDETETAPETPQRTARTHKPRITEIGEANYYVSPVDSFYARETDVLRNLLKSSKYFEDVAKFDWGVTGVTSEKQEELRKPFEVELHPSDLPYFTLPILGPGRQSSNPGTPEVLGLVKIRCKVMAADEDKKNNIDEVEALNLTIRYSPKLKVRVHVLSANGLIPPVGRSSDVEYTEWFLVLRNSKILTSGTHEFRDSRFTGRGFAPDFYRSFELDCEFPNDSLLSLGVASASTVWDSEQILGHSLIDLENRWYHPGHLNYLESLIPIEMRTLKTSWRGDPVGMIRCWIEIKSEEQAITKPMIPITLPPPEKIQVRVVIWQLKNIPTIDTGTMSLYVVGLMAGDEDEINQQETDTHWNSADGRGVFNWRFLFDVSVPGEASQLKLQVWNRNLLAAHEAVAETVLELSADLEKCKSLQESIALDRTWLKLYHPKAPTEVMGLLELELYLVSGSEAADNPVGIGREEPNRDPFLPDVTENRSFISTSVLGTGLFDVSSKVAFGAKIFSWIIAFVVIFTVAYMFRKLFFG